MSPSGERGSPLRSGFLQQSPRYARRHRRPAGNLAGHRSVSDPICRQGPDPGCGKKRPRALAEWSFGGGDRYSRACAGRCPDCPARLNRQQTEDGRQVWDLVGRPSCQLWVIPGAMLGWDMGAALVMAHALGIDTLIAAELLPWIEAVMVRKLNEQIASDDEGGFRS